MRTLILALPFIVAGCATPAPQIQVPQIPLEAAPSAETFPSSRAILEGFDLASSEDDWSIGDQVLLSVTAYKPSGATTRFLLVELTEFLNPAEIVSFTLNTSDSEPPDKFESPVAYTKITVYDEQGVKLETATGRFPSFLLGHGLYESAEPVARRAREGASKEAVWVASREERDKSIRGWMTLYAFSGSLGRKGIFKDMMADVVAKPSLLRMLLNPSVSLNCPEAPAAAETWNPTATMALDTVDLPLVCTVAGKDAASARVRTVRPVAPLSLCSGVISVEGLNAEHDDIGFSVRLLAARRGGKGQGFKVTLTPPTE